MRPAPHCRLMHSSSKKSFILLRKKIQPTVSALDESVSERRNARATIAQLRGSNANYPEFDELFMSLMREVIQHAQTRRQSCCPKQKEYEPTTADAGCDHEP
jgi:hypothetical protein